MTDCLQGFYSLNNCTVSGNSMSCNAYAFEGSTTPIPCTEAAVQAIGIPDPPLAAPELSVSNTLAAFVLLAGIAAIVRGRKTS